MGANIDNIISFFDKSFKSFKVNRFPTTYVRNVSRNNFVVSINHNFNGGVSGVDKQLSFRKFNFYILLKIVFIPQKASFGALVFAVVNVFKYHYNYGSYNEDCNQIISDTWSSRRSYWILEHIIMENLIGRSWCLICWMKALIWHEN